MPHLTKTEVLNRGWTEKMIQRFLGSPDRTKTNPHYRSAARMQLFDESRVVAAERTSDFVELEQKREVRRAGALKAVQTKREKVERYVESVDIKVPVLDEDTLIREACNNYNNFRPDRYAGEHSDARFLKRITVNYLRHRLTEYEDHLEQTYGRVGASEAYLKIKRLVLDAIAAVYPSLADECRHQKQGLA